jgi:hypothetical protein
MKMKRNWLLVLVLAVWLTFPATVASAITWSDSPRFAPTDPAQVNLLRREPRRDHIRLGEVWIRPSWRMDRCYVEGMLREKAAAMGADALVIVADRYFREGIVYNYWYGPRAVYERQIVGIAIRYRR